MQTIRAAYAVIGGGMAGLPIANKLAFKGHPTVLFEKEVLGGTCLNRGCIPTKTMVHSAKVAHTVRTAHRFGVHVSAPEVDLAAIVARKNEIVAGIRGAAYRQVEKNENLTLIPERAVFEGPHRLRAGEAVVEAERIVINTGARATIPPVEGLREVPFHTNRTLLDVAELPASLLIIGGGYVGVEFAQMFARFGSNVTIFQRADRLVPGEDSEISEVLHRVFRKEGIEVVLGAEVRRAERMPDGVRLLASGPDGEQWHDGASLLVAAGRTPNTDDLGLEKAGVETDARGFIPVDAAFRTNRPHVWAIGDVTGPPMFTHSARDDADRLYRCLVKGEAATTEGRHVPHAIFTDPEIAGVGLTEAEARARGFSLKTGAYPFSRVARARMLGETDGFIKIVADAETDRILGAQIVGPHAGELIHELVAAVDAGIPFHQISRSLHIHPTLAEGVNAAAGGVHRPAGEG